MALIRRLSAIVPERIRERGQVLFRAGAVYIFRGDDTEVRASVESTRLYPVSLRLDDGTLNVRCECAYFIGNNLLCKHIWATVLSADAAGYLSGYIDTDGDLDALSFTDEELATAMDRFTRQQPGPLASWEGRLRAIEGAPAPTPKEEQEEILYLLKSQQTVSSTQLIVDVVRRQTKRDGSWGKAKPYPISARTIAGLKDAHDRQILSMILGTADWAGNYGYYGYGRDKSVSGSGVMVAASIVNEVLPLICTTGRGRLELGEDHLVPLTRDEGDPWELWLELLELESGYEVVGRLRRNGTEIDIQEPSIVTAGGFVVGVDGLVADLEDFEAFGWVASLRRQGPMSVSASNADAFLQRVAGLPRLPRLQLPPALQFAEEQGEMTPHLRILSRSGRSWDRSAQSLIAILTFDYGDFPVSSHETSRAFLQLNPRRLVLRDPAGETAALELIKDLGLRPDAEGDFMLAPRTLPFVVRTLVNRNWKVEAEGSLYRTGGRSAMRLVSGIDWFDLEGSVEFGDQTAALPDLLAALRRGEEFVRLDDGTLGILPEEWLQKFSLVAGMGSVEGDAVRFRRNQVGVLDLLLAAQPEVDLDEVFVNARDRLWSFTGVKPIAEPSGFHGELRGYQREGLGWLGFLEEFGFGGCLADDMGLGKTIQVLALLEGRRGVAGNPSLIVVPKSLVFNWLQEAARFTPKLTILDHTGARLAPGQHFDEYDVVLTTYGTMRRDAGLLSLVEFDYCILDEAQAIKNAATASAKAARLLRARHRLALSGTPIENHLGELWSLFEFLNPGMLGGSRAFNATMTGRNPDEEGRTALAQALRPFILRRTKEQVATDLPLKTEQTQFCELPTAQRRHYDQLREHYRKDLLTRVDRDGIAKSKMFVLEALLRLRQAACHPGLIDPSRTHEPSAKLELLMPQLIEVAEEGHKAIVFSQFTKMLSILKPRLDELGIVYEYLDGRTRDRRQRVERFQNDPDCRLFLVSLKAGGLGLNLTAAEYVFLLDPWWNPAVEAQAIDRAHRIGQTKPVFAYRIIARNTVEEKVLQLQASKRALADAIIGEGNSVIREIKREDLELLLS